MAWPSLANAHAVTVAGVKVLAYGFPQAPGYVEQWTPIRFVREAQTCHLCWGDIPAGSPGNTTGSRGTLAWREVKVGLWECLKCREIRTAAELRVS